MAVIEEMSAQSPTAMEQEIASKKKALDKHVEKVSMEYKSGKIQCLKLELEIIELRKELVEGQLVSQFGQEEKESTEPVHEGKGNSVQLQKSLDMINLEYESKLAELKELEDSQI